MRSRRSSAERPLALLALLSVAATPRLALARDAENPSARAALIWEGAPEAGQCMSARDLRDAVEARLERRVFGEKARADLVLRVRFSRAPAGTGWQAELRTESADGRSVWGSRSFSTAFSDCRALDDELVLVAALITDSELLRAEPLRRRAPEPKPAATAEEPDSAPIETAPHFAAWQRAHKRWHGDIDLGGVIAFGVLPHAAFGAELSGRITPPELIPFRVHATAFAPRHVSLTPQGEARFELALLGAALCPSKVLREYEFGLCVGLDAAILLAKSSGLLVSRDSQRVSPAVSATTYAAWTFAEPWAVGIEVLAGAPLERPTYVYERPALPDHAVFRMAPVWAGAGLYAVLRFR
jgi:hypothetical protein